MGRVIERLRGTPGLVLVAVLGLALGVGVGALIWSGSSDSGGSATTGTSADKRPIALPATLAGFRDVTDAMAARRPKAATLARQRANQTKVRAQTVAAYSAAFGGGAAAYRQYADSGLQRLPYVIAVRGSAPRLTIGPVLDPAYLGLAKPDKEVEAVGPVSCQIEWIPPTVAGQTPPASSELTVGCQRSDGGVTVVTGGGNFSGPTGLQSMVDLTNAAWSASKG